MKLTREQAITEHRKMWRWIADETEKRKCIVSKPEYLCVHDFDEHIAYDCFCCEYAEQENFKNFPYLHFCYHCPINWGSRVSTFMCICSVDYTKEGGLYAEWANAAKVDDWRTAAALARQIAELPERETDM